MRCPICQKGMEHCEDTDYKIRKEWVTLNWYQCDECRVGIVGRQIDIIEKLWIYSEEADGDFLGHPFDEVIKRGKNDE